MKIASSGRIPGPLAVSLLGAALLTPIAQAQTWNNPADANNISNSLNWSDETVPATNSGTVLISIGGASDGADHAIYSATAGNFADISFQNKHQ